MIGIASLPRYGHGVVLRRLAPADLAAFQNYRRDPWLGRYQGWAPVSDDEARSFLETMRTAELLRPGAWSQIAIAEPDVTTLIGDIGLRLADDGAEVEIGFTLRRESHGRGLALDAVRVAIGLVFEHTVARRVVAITDARNRSSIRLLERVGMQKTGSASAVFRGEPCIEHTYVMARRTDGRARA